MVNKRDFKKYVDALGASVIEEMMFAYYNIEGADRKGISSAVGKALAAVENAKNNANRFFDRGAKSFADHKEYAAAKRNFFRQLFQKIEKDFNDQINESIKEFNAALPESVKQAQKATVN